MLPFLRVFRGNVKREAILTTVTMKSKTVLFRYRRGVQHYTNFRTATGLRHDPLDFYHVRERCSHQSTYARVGYLPLHAVRY